MIREAVFTAPLSLLTLKDEALIREADMYLPYSVGFEIETNSRRQLVEEDDTTLDNIFGSIPDIMHTDVSFYGNEHRFRIPNGIRGMLCLWNICSQLPLHLETNALSGIHYHIDMTECKAFWDLQYDGMRAIIAPHKQWILDELDGWEYKGTYNSRDVDFSANWIRFNGGWNTAEFRCGEMSFDYQHLMWRMVHANSIIDRFEIATGIGSSIKFEPVDHDAVLKYVTNVNLASKQKDKEVQKLKQQLKQELQEEMLGDTGLTLEEVRGIILARRKVLPS